MDRYGPPRTTIEMSQPAPDGDRYAPEAFAASVGREVTVSAPDGTPATARLVSATVADDGRSVRLVLDVPREFADIVAPR